MVNDSGCSYYLQYSIALDRIAELEEEIRKLKEKK
jgi:hypothetical protein